MGSSCAVLGSGCFGVLDGMVGWCPSGLQNTLEVTITEGFKCFFEAFLVSTHMPLGLLIVPFSFCRVAARLPDVGIPAAEEEFDILVAHRWWKNSCS